MTESKRFTTDNGSHEDICLVDNLTGIEYESNFMDIVNLMNDNWNQTKRFEKHNQELSEKNENLKAAFHREKNTAMKLGMDCDKLFIKNKELEKENEQLKTVINRYEKYSNKKNDELNFRQLDILKLKEENEQLKNENAKMKKELSLLAEFNQKAIL